MGLISKESFLTVTSPRIEKVDLGDSFAYVKEVSAYERDKFETSVERGEISSVRAFWVAMTTCDEKGNLIFDSSDVEALGKVGASKVDRLFQAALKLNGLTKQDGEDLAKNSDSLPSAGS